MKTKALPGRLAILLLVSQTAVIFAAEPGAPSTNTVRIAAAQAARRVIDFRLKPNAALEALEKHYAELERIIQRAGEAKCDALVLPEDTPGLLNWVGPNATLAKEVLPKAVKRMLERLGRAAARHKMYLVVCSDFTESDGATYNTAFLLGRNGNEIGRYHKTCPTWSEAGVRRRGSSFPVFSTPDLGTVGMLICYDLVVPETARCLALAGADIIFFPTMGGAAMGDDDIGVEALRVRAAENFIWLVVAERGSGAMIISPQGKIVAQAEGPDGLAIADINPRGQREGGDAPDGTVRASLTNPPASSDAAPPAIPVGGSPTGTGGSPVPPVSKALAAEYPGDAGIANDPAVLFADNFESGNMKKWDQQRGRVVMTESQPNSGRWCVQMPMERGKNHGGDAIQWFRPGADAVYARCYVKFSPDYQYNHHFVWLGATQRTNKWSAFGKAGLKPNGTYYSTGMEPWFAWGKNPPPGEVNLYTYYLDMEPDRKMNKYWGNAFFPPGPDKGNAAGASRVIPKLNQWQCWEFMIQANTAPDKADGKQAMWVDGTLIGKFTGLRWRTDLDLKVNCFWLEHYGYDEGDPTKQYWKESQSVWFDDVVVARRYIGPIKR